MKIIKVIFLSLLALSLIACTGIFIFFQVFNTDQYLLPITQKASLALGRPVSIGSIGLGLSSRGITLDAGPVTVADDPDFTVQPFIKIDRVRVSLDLKSLLLRREIHITRILLQSPQIHFIRNLEGQVNIQGFGKAGRPDVKRPEGDVIVSEVKPRQDVAMAPSALPNDTVKKEHVLFSGMDIKSIKIQNAAISYIDQNQTFPLDIWLTNINARLNNFSLSKPFQLSSSAFLYSSTPNVHASAMINISSGNVVDLKLDTDLSQVDINLFKGISPDMANSSILNDIAGIVQLNIAHLDTGSSGGVTTNGDLSITGGHIKNFNIIKALMAHTLGAFGVMDGHIDNFLNGPLKDKFGAEDTIVQKAQVKFAYHDKTVFIDDFLAQTNVFELTAKGSMDQGLNMDMQTILHLNADVSAALTDELDGLKLLCDDSNRITIDATLKGVIPHLKYKPNKDFSKKSKKALMKEGANILGIFLGTGDTSSKEQSKKLKKSFKSIFMSL